MVWTHGKGRCERNDSVHMSEVKGREPGRLSDMEGKNDVACE